MKKSSLSPETIQLLINYKTAVEAELKAILEWWMTNITNQQQTSFHGEINAFNQPVENMPISLVMQSRLLWTFSSAYTITQNKAYLQFADTIYQYLVQHFTDKTFGGMYWSVKQNGEPDLDKKQMYGLSFAIYGLSAFYEVSNNAATLSNAEELFRLIEEKSFDSINGGYLECLQRDWSLIEDVRLSDKDENAIKSMNTHLHIIEAYTKLYAVNKNPAVAKAIQLLLANFSDHIIDAESFQQKLFFEKDWRSTSMVVSFGHDIEASWLLYESAVILDESALASDYAKLSVNMAKVVARNIDVSGAVVNEYDAATGIYHKEIHWWQQAEAMVGFFNAFEISGDVNFLHYSLRSWDYINHHLIDREYGEWHWGYAANGEMLKKEKAGFWKCSYHNSRACMEIAQRISKLLD